jgi:competence protein ComEC
MFISEDRQATVFNSETTFTADDEQSAENDAKKPAPEANKDCFIDIVMLKGSRRLHNFLLIAMILVCQLININCGNPVNEGEGGRFMFVVADVAQGLAQFGVAGARAVVWDVGPPGQYAAWRAAYNSLGNPRIELIAISHSDLDHYGGLERFDAHINWNGMIAVSPYEDTAKIRAASSTYWRERIRFQFVTGGDTLKIFSGTDIICLWPPANINPELPLDGRERNHYSLVFSVRHGHSRALITSDIDSVAMAKIAVQSEHGLRAQILSVPHHGSAGSVNSLFFAYASPEIAVISCARQNVYGHPSAAMIDALAYQGMRLMYTFIDNTLTFTSNGYYWHY